MFFSGISRCPLTGEVLTEHDEIAGLPPFFHSDPRLQRYSAASFDFAAAREQKEFGTLVQMFASLFKGERCPFITPQGAICKLRSDQSDIAFFPLLLIIRSPMSSTCHLLSSGFAAQALLNNHAFFEGLGVSLSFDGETLIAKYGPTAWVPSRAPRKTVQQILRRGRKYIHPFLEFLAEAAKAREAITRGSL
jgi:hypothetical protein